jgi:hypothetical protein
MRGFVMCACGLTTATPARRSPAEAWLWARRVVLRPAPPSCWGSGLRIHVRGAKAMLAMRPGLGRGRLHAPLRVHASAAGMLPVGHTPLTTATAQLPRLCLP